MTKILYAEVKQATNGASDVERADGDSPRRDRWRLAFVVLTVILTLILVVIAVVLAMTVRILERTIDETALQQQSQLQDLGKDVPQAVGGTPLTSGHGNNIAALKMVGGKATQTVRKANGSESDLLVIDHWQGDYKSSFMGSGALRLNDADDSISIHTSGVYTIYAQISWQTTENAALVYEIRNYHNSPEDQRAPETLAQCISSFAEGYAQSKSCYTSMTFHLQQGDTVSIAVHRNDFTIDFSEQKSFFGIIGPL